MLKEAFHAVAGFREEFIYAASEDTDLGYQLRLVGGLQYNMNSVAEHSVSDGLAGFMDRFVRYGRGHALLARYYDDPRVTRPPQPPRGSPANMHELLREMCLYCMSWGYSLEEAGEQLTH